MANENEKPTLMAECLAEGTGTFISCFSATARSRSA